MDPTPPIPSAAAMTGRSSRTVTDVLSTSTLSPANRGGRTRERRRIRFVRQRGVRGVLAFRVLLPLPFIVTVVCYRRCFHTVILQDLPDGWQELHDEETGRVYYYNAVNGESTVSPCEAAPRVCVPSMPCAMIRTATEGMGGEEGKHQYYASVAVCWLVVPVDEAEEGRNQAQGNHGPVIMRSSSLRHMRQSR